MTLLLAYRSDNGDIHVASDSASSSDNQMDILARSKFIRLYAEGAMLIGFSGTSRLNQVYNNPDIFDVPVDKYSDPYDYICGPFMRLFRQVGIDEGLTFGDEGKTQFDGNALIAYRSRMFAVHTGWQITETVLPWHAVGSAYPNANSAFYALQYLVMPPEERLRRVLDAAAYFVMDVAPPYHIEKL